MIERHLIESIARSLEEREIAGTILPSGNLEIPFDAESGIWTIQVRIDDNRSAIHAVAQLPSKIPEDRSAPIGLLTLQLNFAVNFGKWCFDPSERLVQFRSASLFRSPEDAPGIAFELVRHCLCTSDHAFPAILSCAFGRLDPAQAAGHIFAGASAGSAHPPLQPPPQTTSRWN